MSPSHILVVVIGTGVIAYLINFRMLYHTYTSHIRNPIPQNDIPHRDMCYYISVRSIAYWLDANDPAVVQPMSSCCPHLFPRGIRKLSSVLNHTTQGMGYHAGFSSWPCFVAFHNLPVTLYSNTETFSHYGLVNIVDEREIQENMTAERVPHMRVDCGCTECFL